MQQYSQIVTVLFSSMTIAAQIACVFLMAVLLMRLFQKKDKTSKKISSFLSGNFLLITFLVTAFATTGSLFLSDIMNYIPCKLCWFQRIFIYPQVLISGIAFFTNDIKAKKYLLPLSIIGGLIAIYHILLQIFPSVLQCGDEAVSCSTNQFVGFSYITIPVMSLTAFVFLILLGLISMVEEKKS